MNLHFTFPSFYYVLVYILFCLLYSLLGLVESGFRHKSVAVRVAAFDAWKTLIDNFADDLGEFNVLVAVCLLVMKKYMKALYSV